MWMDNRIGRPVLVLLCALLVFLLGACGSANANATPTRSVEDLFTAAVGTFSAQQATELALTPPTNTAAPTMFPSLPPLSPFPILAFATPTTGIAAVGACDSATYVADVTIPDNTSIASGASFVKTWKLLNSGSCTWTTSYKLSLSGGDQMGGADAGVAVAVPPNGQTNISVNLVAPSASGSYTGTWRMKNANAQPFGNPITVVIKVGAGGTPAATSASGTPAATTTAGTAAVTIKITGNVHQSNVILTYTDGASKTVKSDKNGEYSLTVPSGWSGTVTPSRAGNHFVPASLSYANVTSDQNGQDYTTTP